MRGSRDWVLEIFVYMLKQRTWGQTKFSTTGKAIEMNLNIPKEQYRKTKNWPFSIVSPWRNNYAVLLTKMSRSIKQSNEHNTV